ncbi:hypothetical protein SLA2020_085840 [Shorea laevis]
MEPPIDEDITEWILEFILRATSDEALQKKLLYALSASNSRFSSRLTKTMALRSIEYEIEDAFVSERILECLEIVDEVDRLQGLSIMDSMKKAYCAVAVECTVKYLASGSNRNGKYLEAVKRIWRGRIGNLEKSKISNLLTEELIELREEIEKAVWDEGVCTRLQERNTRNAALFSVRAYLEEAMPSMGPTILELGSKLMRTVGDDQLQHRVSEENIQEGGECVGDERAPAVKEKGRTRSPEVRQALEALKASSLDLQTSVTDPLPEALRVAEVIALEMARKNATGEVVDAEEGNTESGGAKEVGTSMPSSSHLNTSRQSLMERNSTARTYEWEDSIDDDDSTEGRSKCIRLSSPKKTVLSPLKKANVPKFVRKRKIKRWNLQEEEALRLGVEKYGVGSWKMILKSNPEAFDERTEVDLKDKWRNLTRYSR